MEFIDGGALSDFIAAKAKAETSLDIDEALNILIGVAKGMRYLHGRRPLPIIHRDIKADNILLSSSLVPKIADLGEARTIAQGRTMTMVGTNGYCAPEVLQGEHYGTAADVYSYAITMNELCSLQSPFASVLYDGNGKSQGNWEQIQRMSIAHGLRPQIAFAFRSVQDDSFNDIFSSSAKHAAEFSHHQQLDELIRECWEPTAKTRPSFRVIVRRLERIKLSRSEKKGNRRSSKVGESA